MKKIVGLFLIMAVSSTTVFAQGRGGNGRGRDHTDPEKRWEQVIKELQLDDKQASEFKKINGDFRQKIQKERDDNRDAARENREQQRKKIDALVGERNEKVKKIMTEEQYKKYEEIQGRNNNRRAGGGRYGN